MKGREDARTCTHKHTRTYTHTHTHTHTHTNTHSLTHTHTHKHTLTHTHTQTQTHTHSHTHTNTHSHTYTHSLSLPPPLSLQPQDPDGNDSSLSGGAVAGIVVACIVAGLCKRNWTPRSSFLVTPLYFSHLPSPPLLSPSSPSPLPFPLAGCAAALLAFVVVLIRRERAGNAIFTPLPSVSRAAGRVLATCRRLRVPFMSVSAMQSLATPKPCAPRTASLTLVT